jgi:hypothetical protein
MDIPTKDQTQQGPLFNDNQKKEERFREHWDLFLKYKQEKEQNVRFLSKFGVERNIYQYVNDSVDRMNEFHIKPAHKEPWQNNSFDPITRNKTITVLSQLASNRMVAETICKPTSIFYTKDTKMRKQIYKDLLTAANNHNQEDEQLVWELYTGLSEGTVIGYESWAKGTVDKEYVNSFNIDTGEINSIKIKHDNWDDVYGEIVPMEEFFPETIWVNANEFKRKIHRCFRSQEMTYRMFMDEFGKYPDAKRVRPAGNYKSEAGFAWGIPASVNQENVHVLRFYDEHRDRYRVWGNGTELITGPSPWNHKRLPFWLAVTEPLHQQFLFGKSLPDKLMGMQDINNAIFNAILDQLFLALNSPVFTDSDFDVDEGYLEPGKLIKGDPGSKFELLKMGNVDPTSFQVLSLIKRSMEESSVSAQAQGVATGGRKTKYEVQQLQEGALNLAGLALQLMERAMSQKYLLRMYNILQYYAMPSNKGGKKQFKFLTVPETKLTNGRTGTKLIQIVGSKASMPNKKEMMELAVKHNGGEFSPSKSEIEPVVITRDYLMDRELELEIKIVPNSSVKDSEADKRNKDIAFYQQTLQNPLFDQVAVAKDFAAAFDKPLDIVQEPEQAAQNPAQQIVDERAGMPGMPGMKGQAPQMAPEDLL